MGTEATLDQLLAGGSGPILQPVGRKESELDALLGLGGVAEPPAAPKTQGQLRHEQELEESKGSLKRENQVLGTELAAARGQIQRSQQAIYGMMIFSGLMAIGIALMWLWVRATPSRALEQAFRIINYRENKALSANAIVLDEWSKRMDGLTTKVAQNPGLTDEERAERLKTLAALKGQSEALKEGFVKQLSENEKERGISGGFSYRDPYLKREINLSEEHGGLIDLDKLKEEVRQNANLDATLGSLEEAMRNPIPLREQVRQQAVTEKREGTLQTIDLSKGLAGGPQAPGKQELRLPAGPDPSNSRTEVQ